MNEDQILLLERCAEARAELLEWARKITCYADSLKDAAMALESLRSADRLLGYIDSRTMHTALRMADALQGNFASSGPGGDDDA